MPTRWLFDNLSLLRVERTLTAQLGRTDRNDRVLSFSYDLAGRRTGSADPDHDYDYTYDALDRLTFQSQSITGLAPAAGFLSSFDAASNRRGLVSLVGTTADFLNYYTYDGLNRLTSFTQQDVGGHAVADKRVDFGYDLAGQLDTVKRYTSIADTGGPVALTDFTFDQAGRLDKIEHRAGATPGSGTLLAGYGYTWNQRHELTALDFLPGNSGYTSPFNYSAEDVTYGYDPRGQLTGATGSASESYTYDANGNRETVTNTAGSNQDYDTGSDNRLVDDDTFTYTYDNEGNRLTRTRISTAQANDKVTEYTWDHRNRLVKVTTKNNAGTVTKTVDNAYDAENQWIKRVVDPDGVTGSAAVEQTIFVHENGQIVLQFDKSGSGNLSSSDLSHRYLWGPAVDQLLADEQVDDLFNAVNNDLLWALTDHKGTVHDVVDNSGNVVNHLVYDTAGNVISQTDPLVNVFFRYNGKPYDATIGGYWMQARWYDPAVGRWLSQDIIWDGTNKYAYVGNGPTMFVDPEGLQTRNKDLMKEFGSHRGSEFATDVRPILETTGELIVETNPITGTLLSEERIFLGHDSLRNCDVSDDDRAREALWTLGPIVVGAVLNKLRVLGKGLGTAEQAAADAARLRKLSLVEQLSLTVEEQRFLLREAMSSQIAGGRVAHHIVPLEVIEKFPQLMKKAARGGFDINGCNNGFALLKQFHPENHPQYNQFALDALSKIDYRNLSDAEVAAEVQRLADNARRWLSRRRSSLP